MFSNKLYEVYIVTRDYKGRKHSLVKDLDTWACLTKEHADISIKESKAMDLAGRKIKYTIQCVLLR